MDDIGPILKRWKYTTDDLNVRIIEGEDGGSKLQMRLDLGILQMELDGRPDGKRPARQESYLDYYIAKSEKSPDESFILTPTECLKLQQESIQYYHRYLALMKLEDFERVARDTRRNLRVFDFVEKYSDSVEIVWTFQQYRPYVIMMYTRAVASMQINNSEFEQALVQIDEGIVDIEKFYKNYPDHATPEKFELDYLKQWAEEIQEMKPLSPVEKLNKELEKAIEREDYEHAAILRDELNLLLNGKL